MSNSNLNDINTSITNANVLPNNKPTKQVWCFGENNIFLVSLDKEIVLKLGLNEENTFLEQEIIRGEIIMRVKRLSIDRNNNSGK
jgi:hypothetical protein